MYLAPSTVSARCVSLVLNSVQTTPCIPNMYTTTTDTTDTTTGLDDVMVRPLCDVI